MQKRDVSSMTVNTLHVAGKINCFSSLRLAAGCGQRLAVAIFSVLVVSGLVPSGSAAETNRWDRPANIKEAANHLSKVHRAQGSQGVVKFLDACYRTHTLASEFNRGLEACMAQDYMHSQVLAAIYARLPAEARAGRKVPTPELIAKTMMSRFAAIFAQYKFTQPQSDDFKSAVDKHGFPIFLKAVFPKGPDGAGEKK